MVNKAVGALSVYGVTGLSISIEEANAILDEYDTDHNKITTMQATINIKEIGKIMTNTEDDGKCETCGADADAIIAEQDEWRKQYEDLESHRGACCYQMEEEKNAAVEQLDELREVINPLANDDTERRVDTVLRIAEERDKWLKKYEDIQQELFEVENKAPTFAELDNLNTLYEASQEENKQLRNLLEMAKCPSCDGSGGIPHPVQAGPYGEVTHDMAMDAGDLSLEGTQYGDNEWAEELEQCQWCNEVKKILVADKKEDDVPF